MEPKQPPQAERVSRAALVAMGAIVLALLFISMYSNWRNAQRDRIESVTITRFTPAPSVSPATRGAPR